MKKCVILIPAYNEEKNLKKVIQTFKKYGKTIVVNDNSKDKTKNIAELNAFKTINNKNNIGYDRSIRKGISYILKNFKNIKKLITVDGDGQHQPIFIKKFLNLSNKYDIVIGNRNFYNREIEKKISEMSLKKFGLKDPLTGFKCYRLDRIKKYWNTLDGKDDYFGMFCLLWSNKLKIINSKIYVKKSNKPSSMSQKKDIEKKFEESFLKILHLYKVKF